MLTNSIPLERVFHNDKMWYSFEGYDKKNCPIIKKVPSGSASRIGDNRHFYFSDDYKELYNHWVNNFNARDEYEKLIVEYKTLIENVKDKKIIEEFSHYYPTFFRYHLAFYHAQQITLDELSNKITQHMDKILNHLHVGMVMSEWSWDAHTNYIISKFKYNKKTRTFSINMFSFHKQFGLVGEEREELFDLNTVDGICDFARFMEYDRGYWRDLNEVINAYQEKVDKQIKFIKSVKKLIN